MKAKSTRQSTKRLTSTALRGTYAGIGGEREGAVIFIMSMMVLEAELEDVHAPQISSRPCQ